jgi:hypothetical protein
VKRLKGKDSGLGNGVASVDSQLCTRDVSRSVAEQESDSAHEILGSAHLSLRDEGSPLPVQLGVFVENLASPVKQEISTELETRLE